MLALVGASKSGNAAAQDEAKGSASVSFEICHAFGFRTGINENVAFLNPSTLLYPVGRQVALYSLDDKNEVYLEQAQDMLAVTSMAVCHRQELIAICETTGESPHSKGIQWQVSIFSAKEKLRAEKVKVLTHAAGHSTSGFISVDFSTDSKFIVCQGGAPDWCTVVWDWQRGRKIASYNHPSRVQCTRFRPGDSSQLSSSGDQNLRLWCVVPGDRSLRAFPALVGVKPSTSFVDHCWVVVRPGDSAGRTGGLGAHSSHFRAAAAAATAPGKPLSRSAGGDVGMGELKRRQLLSATVTGDASAAAAVLGAGGVRVGAGKGGSSDSEFSRMAGERKGSRGEGGRGGRGGETKPPVEYLVGITTDGHVLVCSQGECVQCITELVPHAAAAAAAAGAASKEHQEQQQGLGIGRYSSLSPPSHMKTEPHLPLHIHNRG